MRLIPLSLIPIVAAWPLEASRPLFTLIQSQWKAQTRLCRALLHLDSQSTNLHRRAQAELHRNRAWR